MADYYVDTDKADNSGDGTSWATAKKNLNDALAVVPSTLTEATTVHCKGSAADTTAVLVPAITTSSSNRLTIRVDSANRRTGAAYSTGHYRIETASGSNAFRHSIQYLTVDGLQIKHGGGGGYGFFQLSVAAGTQFLINTIIGGPGGTDNGQGVLVSGGNAAATLTMWNDIVYGTGSGAPSILGDGSTVVNIYNCTVVGSGSQIIRNVGAVTNVYAAGSGGADFFSTGTMTTCASADSTGTVGLRTITVSTDTAEAGFVNVTGGSEDFSIKSGSQLQNVGTDLSGTFTVDICGTTRPTGAGTWDIGAFEYEAAATGHPAGIRMGGVPFARGPFAGVSRW